MKRPIKSFQVIVDGRVAHAGQIFHSEETARLVAANIAEETGSLVRVIENRLARAHHLRTPTIAVYGPNGIVSDITRHDASKVRASGLVLLLAGGLALGACAAPWSGPAWIISAAVNAVTVADGIVILVGDEGGKKAPPAPKFLPTQPPRTTPLPPGPPPARDVLDGREKRPVPATHGDHTAGLPDKVAPLRGTVI